MNSDLDHHARAIAETIPACIEGKLPSIGEYLDKRIIKRDETVGCLKENKTGYVLEEHGLWPLEELDIVNKASPIESKILIEYLDLPKLHCYGEECGRDMIEALAWTDQMSIFG